MDAEFNGRGFITTSAVHLVEGVSDQLDSCVHHICERVTLSRGLSSKSMKRLQRQANFEIQSIRWRRPHQPSKRDRIVLYRPLVRTGARQNPATCGTGTRLLCHLKLIKMKIQIHRLKCIIECDTCNSTSGLGLGYPATVESGLEAAPGVTKKKKFGLECRMLSVEC